MSAYRKRPGKQEDTTYFSTVEFQFQPALSTEGLRVLVRLKLKLHAAEAGGVFAFDTVGLFFRAPDFHHSLWFWSKMPSG